MALYCVFLVSLPAIARPRPYHWNHEPGAVFPASRFHLPDKHEHIRRKVSPPLRGCETERRRIL